MNVIKLLPLLFLVGCTDPEFMQGYHAFWGNTVPNKCVTKQFNFQDRVKVIKGFYTGQYGIIESENIWRFDDNGCATRTYGVRVKGPYPFLILGNYMEKTKEQD